MIKRPQNHRTDRKSIAAFISTVPESWVVREKEQDYGIDLEVEIFDQAGNATGLLFYVQMKGTRSAKLEKQVAIKIDRLRYLADFDSPSIICRYCVDTGRLYWMWIFDAFQQVSSPNSRTVTLTFTELNLWSEKTPNEIERTLPLLRKLRSGPRATIIGVSFDFTSLPSMDRFGARQAVAHIISSCSGFALYSDKMEMIPISITSKYGDLKISIGETVSITFKCDHLDYESVLASATYGMLYHLAYFEFSQQARELANFALQEKCKTNARHLAAAAVKQISDSPDAGVDLAILNDIHVQQDAAYAMVTSCLLSNEVGKISKNKAVVRFYKEAIRCQEEIDVESTATIHYSLANYFMNMKDFLSAVHHYNRARKMDVIYLQREYFTREFAAVCFWMGRFKAAARAYQCAVDAEPDAKTCYCLGDALFYSGRTHDALLQYEEVARGNDAGFLHEASLKVVLCHALLAWQNDPSRPTPLLRPDYQFWSQQIAQAQREERNEDVITASLMLAFFYESDEEVWFAALQSALIIGYPETLVAILSAAMFRCDYSVYRRLRKKLIDDGIDEHTIANLDEVAHQLRDIHRQDGSRSVTIRTTGLNHFDSLREREADN